MSQAMYTRIRQLQRAGVTYRKIIAAVGDFSPRTIHQVIRNRGPYQISRLRRRGWHVDDGGNVIEQMHQASTGVD